MRAPFRAGGIRERPLQGRADQGWEPRTEGCSSPAGVGESVGAPLSQSEAEAKDGYLYMLRRGASGSVRRDGLLHEVKEYQDHIIQVSHVI